MRSRAELVLAVVVALAPLVGAAQPDVLAPGSTPSRAEVEKALDKVANDPNLATERTVDMLRFKRAEPVTDEPWWAQWLNALASWLRGLFDFLAESGRYVVWVLAAILAALLALYVARVVRTRGVPRVAPAFGAPSHVRDLDIRPESLPEDVGAAALALWARGEQRAALALLYRGLLSRLVHAHGVPIRASSTEGECLAAARTRLAAPAAAYAGRVVGTWTAAVYGGIAPPTSAVQSLCSEFAISLDGGAS